MLRKPRLFTPGPTPLSPRVREVLSRDIPHHRSDEFRAAFRECRAGLQRFLKTRDDVLLLSCSGSGAMEAADVTLVFVSGAEGVTRSQAAENSATTTMTASERSITSVMSSLLMPFA